MRDIKNEDLMDFIYGFLLRPNILKILCLRFLENEDVDDYDILLRFVDTFIS